MECRQSQTSRLQKDWAYTAAKRPPRSSAPNVCGTSTKGIVEKRQGVRRHPTSSVENIIYRLFPWRPTLGEARKQETGCYVSFELHGEGFCTCVIVFGDSGNRPHYLLFSNSPVGTIKWEILPLFCAAVIWIGEVLTKGLILSKRSLTFLIAKLSCIQITRTYSRTHSKILVRFLINVNLMCVVELYICHGRISIGERPWQPAMGMDCFLS